MVRKFRLPVLIGALVGSSIGAAYIVQTAPQLFNIQLANGPATLVNACVFALYCIVLCFCVIAHRSPLLKVLIKAAFIALWGIALGGAAAGFLMLTSTDSGKAVAFVAHSVAVLAVVLVYFHSRKRAGESSASGAIRKSAADSGQIKYCYTVFYASLSVAMLIMIANFVEKTITGAVPSIPFALATVLLFEILWRVFKWRGLLLPAIVICTACQLVAIAQLETSVLSTVCMTAMIVSLSDLYTRKEATI